jgi:hypothetical protein
MGQMGLPVDSNLSRALSSHHPHLAWPVQIAVVHAICGSLKGLLMRNIVIATPNDSKG